MTTQIEEYKAKAFEPRNLAFFFLIVYGLNAIMWVLSTIFHPKQPTSLTDPSALFWALVVVPTVIGPTLAAFLMTAITEGKPGIKALWGRFWNRTLSLKWLLVTLLFLEVLRLATNLVVRTIDGYPYPIVDTSNPFWMIIPLFLASFIANGMGEEFGWRGYVLPHLQAKWNALTSSIVLGLLWAAWHIPAFMIPNISPLYQRNFWEWLPMILLFTVICTWIFNNTKGSVLAAAILHASLNTSVVVLPGSSLWYYYGIFLLAVILIVLIFGPRNLVRPQSEGLE
ncbi:MAG: CPBP family intramembrane metalloprotease [Anaerolineales bacterium]|jgi:membrane protease YdiL (CAAX protease family)|nr:CPBP family intramembrane metalloprotease [Anaerolineales bacterium]